MATRKKSNKKKVLTGSISIPAFDVDGYSNEMPHCCGIAVIGAFGSDALDADSAAEALGISNYIDWTVDGNGEEDEIFDQKSKRFIRNPKYDKSTIVLDPLLRTEKLTPTEAREWWSEFADNARVSQLLASLDTIHQEFAAKNLQAAGWKALTTFESSTTKNLITVYGFTVAERVCTNPRF